MSSLAGALATPQQNDRHENFLVDSKADFYSDDIEMQVPEAENDVKDEDHEEPDEAMADLFGNDNEVDGVKPEAVPSSGVSANESERLTTPEAEHRKALEYAEEDEPGTVIEQRQEADVSFPNIPLPKSSDGDHWVIRMPNYVTVDSKPYHPDTYLGPEQDDDEALQAETLREKSNVINLKVQNTVRWRWIKDEMGYDRKQSNSRVIRWSDGSLSLRLGKELFDVNQSIDTSGGIPRQSFGGPQASQSQSSQSSSQPVSLGNRSQGLTYLVAQHKRAEVLQSEALITGFMTLRPTGMQSETHRMLVRAVGQKHNKVARLRMAPDPTMDPEREKMELMKQSAKKSKKKAEEDGFSTRKRRTGYSRKRAGHDMWSDDDEEEPEYEASEEEDLDGSRGSRKSRRPIEDEKKKGGDYQEDDFVVADSSDEDGGDAVFDGGGRKRKRGDQDEEVEEDPLDQLDAKIREREAEERKRKRRESGGSKDGETHANDDGTGAGEVDGGNDEEQMDIESEEDEDEEFKVRRAGAGARKKKTIEFEEEEEE